MGLKQAGFYGSRGSVDFFFFLLLQGMLGFSQIRRLHIPLGRLSGVLES